MRLGWAIACNLCHGRPIAGVAIREGCWSLPPPACVSPGKTPARRRGGEEREVSPFVSQLNERYWDKIAEGDHKDHPFEIPPLRLSPLSTASSPTFCCSVICYLLFVGTLSHLSRRKETEHLSPASDSPSLLLVLPPYRTVYQFPC